MASSENSTEDLDLQALRQLLRRLRESLTILAEWTDGLVEMVYEAVHINLNNVLFAEDLVELRFYADVRRQIDALPGKLSTLKL